MSVKYLLEASFPNICTRYCTQREALCRRIVKEDKDVTLTDLDEYKNQRINF